jgi:hypothetical protein
LWVAAWFYGGGGAIVCLRLWLIGSGFQAIRASAQAHANDDEVLTAQTQNIICVKKVNGANVTYPAPGGSIVEWGIESNDTTNSFTKDTKLTATRCIGFGVGLYAPTPAASMTVQPYENNVNWTTMYNGSTGEMTFKRP